MPGTDIINTPPREVISSTDVNPIIPADFASVFRYSELIAESGFAPKGITSPHAIATAIMFGYEIGLTPMAALQSIAVINGRPSVWGDGALAVVRASGQLEDFEETYEGEPGTDQYVAKCRVRRKGEKSDVVGEFSIGDAKAAKLWGKEGPWTNYYKRMMKMRARAFALRDAFTDILRGMAFAEEVSDYAAIQGTATSDEPPAPKEETARKPRGRPAKGNQYQEDKATKQTAAASGDDVTDIDPETGEIAEEKPKSDEPPAPKDDEPPAPEEKKAEPAAEKKQDEPAKENFLDGLISRVGPDKPLKEYLRDLDGQMARATNIDELKAVWNGRDRTKGFVASQEEFIKELRDHHKAVMSAKDSDQKSSDEPPAPDQSKVEFDLAGFLHELDVQLGKAENPDDVNSTFEKMTAQPLALGILTEQMMDEDVRPLMIEHMGRVDFN